MLLVAYYTVKIESSSLIWAVFFFHCCNHVFTFFPPVLTTKAWSYIFAAVSIVSLAVAIMQYLHGAIS